MNEAARTQAVANAPHTRVTGTFLRHVSLSRQPLRGSNSGGRWGPPGGISVLYLGRPRESVVVEAYRHLVDPFRGEGMTAAMVAPRRCVTCEVDVSNVLDLRDPETRARVGLDDDDLSSPIDEYSRCQIVGRAAYALESHGIIVPAATGLGETLALFEQHLPAEEVPRMLDEESWDGLPRDPRQLHAV